MGDNERNVDFHKVIINYITAFRDYFLSNKKIVKKVGAV